MKYETPSLSLLCEKNDSIMVSFEGNTLDLWDMLISGT